MAKFKESAQLCVTTGLPVFKIFSTGLNILGVQHKTSIFKDCFTHLEEKYNRAQAMNSFSTCILSFDSENNPSS